MKTNFWRIFWGAVLVVVGFLYLLDSFGYLDFSIWGTLTKLWPVVLIIIGLLILFSRRARNVATCFADKEGINRFIGDIRMEISPKDVDGSRISSFIGDVDLILRDGELNQGVNKLLISSFIGDATITLPKELPLMVEQSSFLGDLKIDGGGGNTAVGKNGFKSANYDESPDKFNIRFNVFIGDLRIIVR